MKWVIPFMWGLCQVIAWICQFIGVSGLLVFFFWWLISMTDDCWEEIE